MSEPGQLELTAWSPPRAEAIAGKPEPEVATSWPERDAMRLTIVGGDPRDEAARGVIEREFEREVLGRFVPPEPGPLEVAAGAPVRKPTIAERCAEFDAAHPEVYAELRRLALDAVRRGRRHLGIAQLVEVARWNLETDARDDVGYKLNNDFRAVWARRLMADEHELRDVFETRDRRTA